MNSNVAKKIFETEIPVQLINDYNLNKAKEIFQEYTNNKIIKNTSFEDSYWRLSDEYSNVGFDYSINWFIYHRSSIFKIGIEYNDFIIYLKIFALYSLGKYSLITLQQFLNDIRNIIEIQFENMNYSVNIYCPYIVNDFFSSIPVETSEIIDTFLDFLDYYADYQCEKSQGNMRQLASFDTYFLFNDIIMDYWEQDLCKEERLFYYPIYLWWRISGVIPLRPREFILTPRNCLVFREGEWWIKIRRNELKGSNTKKSYKIDLDYRIEEYPISNSLADELKKYIELTENYESNELNTLFITDTHYNKWFKNKIKKSRYLTYTNMNTILRYFYNEILLGKYHLKLVKKGNEIKRLNDFEIQYINLGDTRVISMINVMLEGGTPALAMWLSGHDSLGLGFNYYGNLTMLIECRTYKEYRRVLQGNITYYSLPIKKNEYKDKNYVYLENGDRCYSEKFIKGSYIDCLKVSGEEGEIGYCPSCNYFRRNGSHFFASEDMYKAKIEDSCKFLSTAIENARKMNGNTDEIKVALMKIQNSSFEYEQYLKEKTIRGKANEV